MRNSNLSGMTNKSQPDRRLGQRSYLEAPRTPISSTSGPQSPVRAIYPPDSIVPSVPMTPTSPIRAGNPEEQWQNVYGNTGKQLSPIGEKVFLPDDMYPKSPPPGTKRMRLPNQPFTPIDGSLPSAVSLRSPRLPDPYPRPPEHFGLPERPNSSNSRVSQGRRGRNIRINSSARPDDDEDRAPLSATFQAEQRRLQMQKAMEPPTPESSSPETGALAVRWPEPRQQLRFQNAPTSQPQSEQGPMELSQPPLQPPEGEPQLPNISLLRPTSSSNSIGSSPLRRNPNLTIQIGHKPSGSVTSIDSKGKIGRAHV